MVLIQETLIPFWNPRYGYTHRNCSFTPKSLTWISAKFRVILFKRASYMIMKSNDHDKNPEKVNELLKEMTTGNKLGLQYSFNLSSQESTIFVIIQPKIKCKKDHYCTRSQKAIISLMGLRPSSLFSYFYYHSRLSSDKIKEIPHHSLS